MQLLSVERGMDQAEKHKRASVIIAECMRRRDAGQPVHPERVLADHPEISAELQEYFEGERRLANLLGGSGSCAKKVDKPPSRRETVRPSAGDSVPAAGESFQKLPMEFGRYRVQKVLGQGAMGAVYLAHDTKLGRDVALKTPKLDAFADGELIERFEREARAAATLHHRNICPVFDVGEIKGVRFLTMAYIEGRPLSAFVSEDKPLSRRQAAMIVRKLALGLQEAHTQGVVHRDLKPANVMIDKALEPVVMDFGLAHQAENADQSRLTGVGVLMGSPAYMSPEQVSGEPDAVGPASDIYSLGVILFELLSGRLPYEGSVVAIIGQIVSADPPDVRTLRPNIDETLAAICSRMMARSPTDRYAVMKEVADALTGYLRDDRKSDAGQTGAQSLVASDLVFEDAADSSSAELLPNLTPQTQGNRRQPGGNSIDRLKRMGGGLMAVLVLAAVIIKLTDGTTIEIPDGKTALVETNDDGSLKSLTVVPAEDESRADEAATDDRVVTGGPSADTPDMMPPLADTNGPEQPTPFSRFFVYPGGYFIQGLDHDWFQKWADGNQPPNLFREVQRTDEYIELRHRHVRTSFLLYRDKSLFKDERKKDARWVTRHDGRWLPSAEVTDQSRSLWVHPHGYFLQGRGTDWFETWDDGRKPPNMFRELKRTEDFVALQNVRHPVRFRLWDDRATAMKKDGSPVALPYAGQWQDYSVEAINPSLPFNPVPPTAPVTEDSLPHPAPESVVEPEISDAGLPHVSGMLWVYRPGSRFRDEPGPDLSTSQSFRSPKITLSQACPDLNTYRRRIDGQEES